MQGPGSLGVVSQVVISGGGNGTGLFLYNGAPALGNVPIFSITSGTLDPPGNTVPAALQTNSLPILIYSGSAMANDLSIGISPANGTDVFGNTLYAGFTSYLVGTPTTRTTLSQGQLNFWQSGYVSPAQIFTDNLAALQLISAADAGQNQSTVVLFPGLVRLGYQNNPGAATTLAILAPTSNATGAFTSGAWTWRPVNDGAGHHELFMDPPTGATSSIFIIDVATQFVAAAAATVFVSIQVTGDTNNRWQIDSNGKQQWGPGNAAVDTDLFRSGPNALNTDGQFLAGGVVQSLSGMQILVNSTTNTVFEIATLLAANGRYIIDGNGKTSWGVGGATAVDTDLYREAAGVLATDSIFALGNQAVGIPASIASFTQIWSDSFTQLHTDRAVVSEVNFEGKNQIAIPGAGGSGAKLYSQSGHQQIRSAQTGIGGDTLSYDCERLDLWLTADTASQSNTTAANIPGLATKTVQATTYKIRAHIICKQGAAAGNLTVALAGPAVSAGGMSGVALDNGNVNHVNQTAGLGTQTQAMTNIGRSTTFDLEGVVTFSASGVLSVQANTSAVADTYIVQAGSYWELSPVVAT